ncbi:hypothetical protein C0993_009580 [Termitomyces sp. T159_Od127]|nr:hypothetical protein C0993_009580 [Termitomyces sp. T159_Od127]
MIPPHRLSPTGGTNHPVPPPLRQLPTQADLGALLNGDTSPVKSASEARHWMELCGWILAGEPYDRTKLVHMLMTAAMASKSNKLKNDVKNAVLTAMFLLEDNVTNQTAEVLAGAVASKVLSTVSLCLAFRPPAPGPPGPTLWDQHIRMQQRLVRSAKTVLVDVDALSVDAPQDCSPNGIFKLHKKVNAYLVEIDSAMAAMAAIDGAAASPVKTLVRSITAPTVVTTFLSSTWLNLPADSVATHRTPTGSYPKLAQVAQHRLSTRSMP